MIHLSGPACDACVRYGFLERPSCRASIILPFAFWIQIGFYRSAYGRRLDRIIENKFKIEDISYLFMFYE